MINSLRRLTGWLLALGLFLAVMSGCATKAPVVNQPPVDPMGDQYVANADKMASDGQYKTSNYFYRRAIVNYEKNGTWEEAIKCYIKLGDNYQKLDDVETALGTLNQALRLTKTRLGHQHLALAESFQRLAYKSLRNKEFDRALDLYQKALTIQLEVLGDEHPEVARTYNGIALVYLNKKQVSKANMSYLRSYGIKLLQTQGVPEDMEKKYRSLEAPPGQFNKGAFSKARDNFSRSLDEYRKLFGQNKPLFAVIYEQIGILYALEGDYDNALEYMQRAFRMRLEIYGDLGPETAVGYLNIGICLRLKGDYDEAFKFLNIALRITRESLGDFHPDTSDIYCQMGKVYFQRNLMDEALDYFQKALVALVPGFGDGDAAAEPPLDMMTPRDKLLDILTARARALKMKFMHAPNQLDGLQAAYSTYLLIVRLVEAMRQGYKSESYKLFFGEKIHALYQEGIETALLLADLSGNPIYRESAFILSEKSKASVLAEALSEANAKEFAGIPDSLLLEEKRLKERLTYYDTCLQAEYYSKEADAAKIKSLENSYHSLVLEYRRLIDRLESGYQRYYELKYKPVRVDIPEIQRALDSDSALVEYFIGDEVLHIFVLTREGLEVVNVHLVGEDLGQVVVNYNRAIKKIEEMPFWAMSRRLYTMLLNQVRPLLAGKKKLIIIPDGPLSTIPFESLAAGPDTISGLSGLDYMIKHFAFSYHYSANLWLYSFYGGVKQTPDSFLGFAPVFGEKGKERLGYVLNHEPGHGTARPPRLLGLLKKPGPGPAQMREASADAYDMRPEVSRLPASEEELRSIIHLFHSQGKKAAGYFYRKATESNFKASAREAYDLLHIATHSLKDSDKLPLSGLIFSSPGGEGSSGDKEDGILYSGEIYNLDMDADLIVLSSCESGVGKLVKGEGMMALNRGFFYSGIRNIVFSLWKVEDRSTSRLMIAFYRNILNGLPFSRALREAKLEMLDNPFTAFPKYWSGFVLVGK
jgi:CHAT domain-containing protein/Tfp pilus assembly protein PilF